MDVRITPRKGVTKRKPKEAQPPPAPVECDMTPEAIMLASFDSLLDAIADERSCVQAAVKLLDSLENKAVPEALKAKLRGMEQKAFGVVTHISRWGSVAAARNIANSFLLKHLVTTSPDAWRPEDPIWRQELQTDLTKAEKSVGL